jgi:hypothetical protein
LTSGTHDNILITITGEKIVLLRTTEKIGPILPRFTVFARPRAMWLLKYKARYRTLQIVEFSVISPAQGRPESRRQWRSPKWEVSQMAIKKVRSNKVADEKKKEDAPKASAASAKPAPAAPTPEAQQTQEVVVDDANANAGYANFCRVSSTPEELILDLGLNPTPYATGKVDVKVTQRIILNHFTAKRLWSALSMALQRHEQAFGVLETDVRKRVKTAPVNSPAG